jgi:hypothetical protein
MLFLGVTRGIRFSRSAILAKFINIKFNIINYSRKN